MKDVKQGRTDSINKWKTVKLYVYTILSNIKNGKLKLEKKVTENEESLGARGAMATVAFFRNEQDLS